ncbi:hypothetical protein H8959_015982 [Pygathrix nigripes]
MSRSGAAAEKADSRQRPQMKVNEYKENQNIAYVSLRPVQTTVLIKTAKVYLAPFSLSNYQLDQLMCPKSLLEKNSNNEVACKKTKIKKTCRRIIPPKMKTTSSKSESTLQYSSSAVHTESNKLQPKRMADAMNLSVDVESSQDGDSDEDITPGLDDFSGLSPYERKRLKNISENADFFASLQLSESAARLREIIEKRQPPKSKRKKPKRENGVGCRRSMRLLKVDPLGVSLPATPTLPTLVADETPLLPPGPLEMTSEDQEDNERFKGFLYTWAGMNKPSSKNTEKGLSSIKSYRANLNGMVISEDTVYKVTTGPIFSMALHPSETRTLVAVGAKFGQLGLCDLDQIPYENYAENEDTHIYDARQLKSRGSQPLISLTEHTKSIASAYFSPVTGNRVVTTCADCNLRIFDSSCVSYKIPLLTTIRHNTFTGRWLTRFQAMWDPKQEDCVIVGSMAHPRRVEIFHETGKRVHSFGGECLVSVCSINAMHPTRYILAGGNSSGKIHVFMNEKSC